MRQQCKQKRLQIFSNLYFYRDIPLFQFEMAHYFIHMTAMTDLVVSHSIGPIFVNIFDCMGSNVSNSNAQLCLVCRYNCFQ